MLFTELKEFNVFDLSPLHFLSDSVNIDAIDYDYIYISFIFFIANICRRV